MKKLLIGFLVTLCCISCKHKVSNTEKLQLDGIELKDSIKNYSYHTPSYIRRKLQFEQYKVTGKIVWIGDSITDEIELNELFSRGDIVNRGIGMDIVQGVKERIEKYILDKPKQIVLFIGVNNLRYFPSTNPTQLYNELISLVYNIKKRDIPILLICPLKHGLRDNHEGVNVNDKINTLDSLLGKNKTTYGFEYVNLNNEFVQNEFMKDTLTNDGIHLLPNGLCIIKKLISPYLK